ncbi:acyl-CoA dehydrogenase family protein [Fictibacillus terranigra]|uniref:Acyl-CoA dehydrogenase family protein n=1 Tax=Fictibacillus terranigra TaxID=3058424 RepID=A0ABT8E949_9BACL|nr:acyl-CoA dehydrogenase family protein [Fictibacillus sp. CENA-BCM004]MDN4074443.1 acyl-CoA dehydrogenase family protein [Fictibacillus sp. CENA-BCM004]
MISFKMSPHQIQVKEVVHWFAENEMRPISLASDQHKRVPDEWLENINQLGIQLSTSSFGDSDSTSEESDQTEKRKKSERQGNRLAVIAAEELGWGDPAIALTLPGPGLGGPPVQASGTPEQKRRFMSIFSRDEPPRWGAYALTEPEAGSDVSGLKTTAVKTNGGYILNGQKVFITNGARASWVVVFATVDQKSGRAGHRAFVVEKGTPGFSCTRLADKMGLRASETAELLLEDCFVPEENLLGGESYYEEKSAGHTGFRVAMQTFDNTRPIIAAMATGIARAAFEYTLDFVQHEYPKHGRSFHTASTILAKAQQEIDASRLLTWEAAWKADMGKPNAKEAAMCKSFSGTISLGVCSRCLEVLGPDGVEGHLVEKLYRDAKIFDIFEGTNQIQHLIIARHLYEPLGVRI